MKHSITTYNTKRTIAESLKGIMKTKPFSKITVSEIIADCGINRKTFYYHFDDIYALLKWIFDDEAINVVKHIDLLTNYEDAIRFAMDYIEKNDYIISCVYDSIGRDEMKRLFYTDFMSAVTSVINAAEQQMQSQIDSDFKEYVAKFYTEALSGMIIEWAKEKDKRDKEKTIKYLTTIIETTLSSIEYCRLI